MERRTRGLTTIYLIVLLLGVTDRVGGQTVQEYINDGQQRYDHQDLQGALKSWKQGLDLARTTNNRPAQDTLLMNLGNVNDDLKNYSQAFDSYKEAVKLARELKDRVLEMRSLNGLGNIYTAVENPAQAQTFYEQALNLAREIKDRTRETKILSNLGFVFEKRENYSQAQTYYAQALQVAREIGDRDQESRALDNLGRVNKGKKTSTDTDSLDLERKGMLQLESGNLTEALNSFERQLQIGRDSNNPATVLASLIQLGIVYNKIGDYEQALSVNAQAMQLAKGLSGQFLATLTTLNNQGSIYLGLGNYDRARASFEEMLKSISEDRKRNLAFHISFRSYIRSFEKNALQGLGSVFFGEQDYTQAQNFYNGALKLARELGVSDKQKVSLILGELDTSGEQAEGNLGEVYLALGRHKEAYEIFKRLNHPNRLGRYYLSRGEYELAREKFAERLEPRIGSWGGEEIIESHIGLGKALEGLRKYSEAKSQYQQAVNLIEQQREKLTESQRRYFFTARANGFFLLDAYEGLVRVSMYLQDAAEGLFWAENTRARVLLEAVSRHASENRLGLPADLARQENDFISRLSLLAKQQKIAFMQQNTERLTALTQDFTPLKDEWDRFVTRLRNEYPAYTAIRYPQPIHVTDLTPGSEEALLEYEVTEIATFAWLIKGQQIRKAVIIPVTRAKLTEKVLQYRGFFAGISDYNQLSQFDPHLGKYLYDLLFKAVATLLKEEDRLVIIPDEILGTLPFEALVPELPPTVTYASGTYGTYPKDIKYLGDQYPIRYSQSASALVQARSLQQVKPTKAERVLVIADPVFSLADTRVQGKTLLAKQERGDQVKLMRSIEESQPSAETGASSFAELTKIRELSEQLKQLYGSDVEVLSGVTASEAALRKQPLADYRELIFATHGVLAQEVATVREPALVLNQVGVNRQDPEQDGFLTLSEVMGLSLNAEVAALIACNTGVGKTQTGEGVMGMGRAFQYAGAKSVLMSLWSVNEESTTRFAEQFFAQLKAGKDRLSAIRFARTEIRKAGYEHPFFWAPFILVGER